MPGGNTYYCQCHRLGFRSQEKLEDHIRYDHEHARCKFCGKHFKTKTALRLHLQVVHSGENSKNGSRKVFCENLNFVIVLDVKMFSFTRWTCEKCTQTGYGASQREIHDVYFCSGFQLALRLRKFSNDLETFEKAMKKKEGKKWSWSYKVRSRFFIWHDSVDLILILILICLLFSFRGWNHVVWCFVTYYVDRKCFWINKVPHLNVTKQNVFRYFGVCFCL